MDGVEGEVFEKGFGLGLAGEVAVPDAGRVFLPGKKMVVGFEFGEVDGVGLGAVVVRPRHKSFGEALEPGKLPERSAQEAMGAELLEGKAEGLAALLVAGDVMHQAEQGCDVVGGFWQRGIGEEIGVKERGVDVVEPGAGVGQETLALVDAGVGEGAVQVLGQEFTESSVSAAEVEDGEGGLLGE